MRVSLSLQGKNGVLQLSVHVGDGTDGRGQWWIDFLLGLYPSHRDSNGKGFRVVGDRESSEHYCPQLRTTAAQREAGRGKLPTIVIAAVVGNGKTTNATGRKGQLEVAESGPRLLPPPVPERAVRHRAGPVSL